MQFLRLGRVPHIRGLGEYLHEFNAVFRHIQGDRRRVYDLRLELPDQIEVPRHVRGQNQVDNQGPDNQCLLYTETRQDIVVFPLHDLEGGGTVHHFEHGGIVIYIALTSNRQGVFGVDQEAIGDSGVAHVVAQYADNCREEFVVLQVLFEDRLLHQEEEGTEHVCGVGRVVVGVRLVEGLQGTEKELADGLADQERGVEVKSLHAVAADGC